MRSIQYLTKEYGSSLLELVLVERIWREYPNDSRGEADQRRQSQIHGVLDRMADRLELSDLILIGRSVGTRQADAELTNRMVHPATERLIGTIALFSPYEEVSSLLLENVRDRSVGQVIDSTTSYKSELQEFSQGHGLGTPRYETVAESGPDHCRIFRVRVKTMWGRAKNRWAEGEGPTKKGASEAAAQAYFKKYVPTDIPKPRAKVTPRGSWDEFRCTVPQEHQQKVVRLAEALRIPPEFIGLLSQALTHVSYLNEATPGRYRDGGRLAQLGGDFLDALAKRVILDEYLTLPSTDPV